jgi:hypothetical protein
MMRHPPLGSVSREFPAMTAETDYPAEWTDRDFDGLSWHDCCVHAIRFRNPDEGYDFDLILDIDYILKWIETPARCFNFSVAPALLSFRNVHKLAVDLELAGKEGLEINSIERHEVVTRPELGLHIYQWIIHFHSFASRDNQIRFASTGFVMKLTSPPQTIDCQRLRDGES